MIIVGTAFAILLAGQAAASAPAPEATTQPAVDIPAKPTEPTLEQVRAATERYRDVKVALAEGYERDPTDTCETAELMGRPAGDGAMGIHFAHPGRLGFRQGATDRLMMPATRALSGCPGRKVTTRRAVIENASPV